MATVTVTRTATLPNSSGKTDFYNLIDTATASVSGITSSDFTSGTTVVVRQSTAPSDTNVVWVDTNTTPYVVRIYDGTEWIATGGYAVLTNKSGAQRVAGDVVVIDSTNNGAFTVSSISEDPKVFGVVMETINDAADGVVAISGGRVTSLKVAGAVARGDRLVNASGGLAKVGGINTFAIALASIGGAGTLSEALLVQGGLHCSTVGASGTFLRSLGTGANPLWASIFSGLDTSNLVIKAINFSGTTANKTIGGSHTVTNPATGKYTITWATAFSDANYIVLAIAKTVSSGSQNPVVVTNAKSTTAVDIEVGYGAFSMTNTGEVSLFAIGT